MTCNSCVAKVKSALLKLGHVQQAEVQREDPQATITMQQHISTATLQAAVAQAGPYTLTEADATMHHGAAAAAEDTGATSYLPIFLIFAYVAGAAALAQWGGTFSIMLWMQHFMAGFFLVFSFFKLMNLKGFAEGYRSYDVVARAIPAYGFAYPFIELALGLAYLTGFAPLYTNIITLVVMSVSSIGVIQSLLKKTPFQCACLGTVIKLPLSKVTLVEDLLMVAMSLYMLLTMI